MQRRGIGPSRGLYHQYSSLLFLVRPARGHCLRSSDRCRPTERPVLLGRRPASSYISLGEVQHVAMILNRSIVAWQPTDRPPRFIPNITVESSR